MIFFDMKIFKILYLKINKRVIGNLIYIYWYGDFSLYVLLIWLEYILVVGIIRNFWEGRYFGYNRVGFGFGFIFYVSRFIVFV